MAKRVKVITPAVKLSSWDEADQALGKIAVNKARIDQAEAAYNEKEQLRRQKLTEEHAPLRQEISELELGLQQFCEDNRADFGKSKSKVLQHGTVNFRVGTPKVEKKIKAAWEHIMELVMKSKYKELFIRKKEELNKEAIIDNQSLWEKSNGEDGIDPKEIQEELGIVVTQDETFGYTVDFAVGEGK